MQEAVENFEKLTQYDLSGLFTALDVFFNKQVPQLRNYYNGQPNTVNALTFQFQNKLQSEVRKVLELFAQCQVRFTTLQDWELLEVVEEFRTKLDTVANMAKYLRSGRSGGTFTTNPTALVQVAPSTTIEHTLRNINGDPFAQDNWVVMAISQDIKEEDYGPDAEPIVVQVPVVGRQGLQLQSVLGYPLGAEALGRDLNRVFTFVDDDLDTLDPLATKQQSFEILLGLRSGDIPEYEEMGLDEVVGLNRGTVAYRLPAILRQLRQTFGTDDTFIDVNIGKLAVVDDSFQLEVITNTVYGAAQQLILNS